MTKMALRFAWYAQCIDVFLPCAVMFAVLISRVCVYGAAMIVPVLIQSRSVDTLPSDAVNCSLAGSWARVSVLGVAQWLM